MEDVGIGSTEVGTESTHEAGQNTETGVETSAEAPKTHEVSPLAKKAREAMDSAKRGEFASKTDDNTPKTGVIPPPNTTAVVVPPAFTPNFKFKANKQELEFDELFKGLVKDADTEKKIRKLHEDAHGLEPVKAYAENVTQKYKDVSTKFGTIDREIKMLSHHVKNEDYDSFLEALEIPKDKIFNWVHKKLKEMELGPEAQAELERHRQNNKQNFLLSEENQQFKSASVEHAVQARTYDLDMELIKPEVSQVAQSFDAKVGRPGAFREECMNRGVLAWQFAKKDLSAAEAVGQVISLMGRVLAPNEIAQPPQVSGQASGQNPPAPKGPPPVIPNISGRSTSPVKAAPKSISDLRKLAKNYAGAEGA